jgi:hypothetical protein
MIHPLVKIITVDGFFSEPDANRLCNIAANLNYQEFEYGQEIPNFNMVPEDANDMFSTILGTKMEVIHDQSGVFRRPVSFIHFESFDGPNEWVFACALMQSDFNVFEHQSGAANAREGYRFDYRNLFEWDLQINYILKPGQGVLFRPWLFHSFNHGLIQIFRLRERDVD